MPRPQFRLSTLLWITLAVACFFGCMKTRRLLDEHRIDGADVQYAPGTGKEARMMKELKEMHGSQAPAD